MTSAFEADQKWGKRGPWDSVYKIAAVVRLGLTPQNIIFILEMVHHLIDVHGLVPSELTKATLSGTGGDRKSGTRIGLIQLILFKKELCAFLTTKADICAKLDVDSLDAVRKAMSDVAAYKRTCMGTDVTWRGALTVSVQKLATLIEAPKHTPARMAYSSVAASTRVSNKSCIDEFACFRPLSSTSSTTAYSSCF
jgi:hypothetical protein